jgi:hypothetical protein
MNNPNLPVSHPPQEQLLQLSDGELTVGEAAAVRSHLEQCWQCRSRLDEMEAGIADYMRYEEEVLKPLLPGPPRPWADLDRRLDELDAASVKQASTPSGHLGFRWLRWPEWFAAATAVTLAALMVWRFERVPEVHAAELLTRAAAREAAAPKAKKARRIRVRTRARNFVRAASLPPDSAESDDLRKLFAEAHYSWDNPLSADSYRAWREQLAGKEEYVETSRDRYVIHTASHSSALTDATLTLRVEDLHAVRETLQFQAGEWVELAELDEDEAPAARPEAPVMSPAPKQEAPVAPNSVQTPPAQRAAGPAEELKVVAALHRIGADLGEPIEVSRLGSKVLVAALDLTAHRKEQLQAAVAAIPGVELRFDEPQLMTSRPNAALPQRRSPAGALSAFQLQLQDQLGDADSVDQFTNRVLDASEAAMARAYALRALARRFPSELESQLGAQDLETLAGVRRDHLEALTERWRDLDRKIRPLLANLTSRPLPAATARSPQWQAQTQQLFAATERMDQLLNGMLAGGDVGTGGASELAAALNNLGAQLTADR